MKDSDNSTQMIASTEQCPVHNQLFGKGNIKFNKTPYVYVWNWNYPISFKMYSTNEITKLVEILFVFL